MTKAEIRELVRSANQMRTYQTKSQVLEAIRRQVPGYDSCRARDLLFDAIGEKRATSYASAWYQEHVVLAQYRARAEVNDVMARRA